MFSRKVQHQTDKIEAYLELIPLPKLTKEQTLSCEGIISEDKVFKRLKYIENNKSPGNDGLSKKLYECFWNEIKNPFLASVQRTFLNQELSSSQKQALTWPTKYTVVSVTFEGQKLRSQFSENSVLQIYEFVFNFDGKISKEKRIMKVPRIKK